MAKTNTPRQSINDFIKSSYNDRIHKSSLVSFTTETDEINFYSFINYLEEQNKDYFYYSRTEQGFQLAATGEALSLNFKDVEDLNNFSEDFSKIQNNIFHNFDKTNFHPPLFFFSAKFPSAKSSFEWKDYNNVKLYIPEIVFIKVRNRTYFTLNVKPHSNVNRLTLNDKLLELLTFLEQRSDNLPPRPEVASIKMLHKQDYTKWKVKVEEVLERIKNKEFEKLVLARSIEFDLSEKINPSELAVTLDNRYPECFNILYKVNGSLFFSASPEKLFIVENGEIHTEALAGSIERGYNESEDRKLENTLSSSSKDIDEHVYVIDHLKNVLKKYCREVNIDKSPSLKKLTNIQHLHTGLSGKTKNRFELLRFIKDIFPTPAVGGYPVEPTIKIIDQIEDFDRGLFTGFVGWLNQKSDGEFIVAIRSGLINNNKLYVYAGCGIVPGSDPEKEYEETQLKSEAIISLFKYENKD